ncbi:hypothetical protein GCM10010385_60170 [Streptomyces geysiriensis]|nr:hypothetical protein GCM10010385_60170 [Streptomyces geysiriensis]GHB94173.1 hypothetical protein GCM10010308_01030 [Streptomyces vinaceusdrappus]
MPLSLRPVTGRRTGVFVLAVAVTYLADDAGDGGAVNAGPAGERRTPAEPDVSTADHIVLTGDIPAGPQPTFDLLTSLGDGVIWISSRSSASFTVDSIPGRDAESSGASETGSWGRGCWASVTRSGMQR